MSAPAPRTLTIGESMGLVRGDGIGGLEHLATAWIDTGGAEGNVAVGLVRLGLAATWLGRVGDDALGRRVCGDLRAEGVEVVGVVDPDAPTGLMLKTTPRAGTTAVDYYRSGSAGSRLSVADLDAVDVADFDAVHVTGITPALSPSAAAAVDALVDAARAAGVLVSFDVNFRSRLWSRAEAAPVLTGLAARADLVFAGDDEIALLVPEAGAADPVELADLLAARTGAVVALKRGGRGAVVVAGEERLTADAVPVDVVDTVGAGDAFAAAFLAETLHGHPLAQRLAVAVRAGALACTHPGDWQGFARRDELDRDTADPVAR